MPAEVEKLGPLRVASSIRARPAPEMRAPRLSGRGIPIRSKTALKSWPNRIVALLSEGFDSLHRERIRIEMVRNSRSPKASLTNLGDPS